MHVVREIDHRSNITTCKKWGRVKWDDFYELEELIDYFFQYPMVFNYKIRGLCSRKFIEGYIDLRIHWSSIMVMLAIFWDERRSEKGYEVG